MSTRLRWLGWAFIFAGFFPFQNLKGEEKPEAVLSKLKLPAGFKIEMYAYPIPHARSLTQGPNGILFVGTREKSVYAVLPNADKTRAQEVIEIIRDQDMPNGVAYKNGSLYVGLINQIIRFDEIEKNIRKLPQPVVVYDQLPSEKHHGWKFIAFGPDEKLYIPIGAPCNVCKKDDPRFAAIHRLNFKTKKLETVATGVRNTVGFDWHPKTHELWFTDNGRDMMGDDLPPDELNRVSKEGSHFGFPFCHGGDIADPEFGKERNCREFVKPEFKLDPHGASLGMRFYTGSLFPETYRGGIFIAQRGSWNRTSPSGYRVLFASLGNPKKITPFIEGWLDSGKKLGRPVDVLPMADGSLLISDDFFGAIYRVTYKK